MASSHSSQTASPHLRPNPSPLLKSATTAGSISKCLHFTALNCFSPQGIQAVSALKVIFDDYILVVHSSYHYYYSIIMIIITSNITFIIIVIVDCSS